MSNSPVFLGFDTGGTYTDAVLWRADDEAGALIASAKALTTRHDLAVGIAGALQAVLAKATGVVTAADIALVSMSTTLATNALVEGQGSRAGLVLVGLTEGDLARDGLGAALGTDPFVCIAGGHDVHGRASPLDLDALDHWLTGAGASVSSFAVAALFATRNAAHELAVSARIAEKTGLPVTASHELSSKLGGPKRALTTLLNARLIAMITRLIAATASTLDTHAIRAPLMVVRGDGALVSAAFAMRRPIETILSGPAASLVGARVLTGLDNAFVSDIGGTTTDVAVLDHGRPRLDPEGATVGGFRTMVEAVAMRTFGLGGDSEVVLQLDGMAVSFKLGPRRLVPLSLAATMAGETVLKALERQLSGPVGRLDGRFAFAPDVAASGAGLTASEAQLLARLTSLPQALDSLLSSTSQAATLDRLVTRGLAQIAGFTPSDAAHVLGRQDNWNADAAKLGAALLARRKDNRGMAIATSAESLSASVLQALSRRSAEVIMETALVEDGLDPALVRSPLLQRGLDGVSGHVSSAFSLDRPLIGLGASAGLHYAELDKRLGVACIVPPDAGVANAVGAVAGQVRISATVTVARPDGERFRVSAPSGLRDFLTEDDALVFAEQAAREEAIRLALSAGAAEPHCAVASSISAPMVEGQRSFMDAQIVATASGRPTIARASSST